MEPPRRRYSTSGTTTPRRHSYGRVNIPPIILNSLRKGNSFTITTTVMSPNTDQCQKSSLLEKGVARIERNPLRREASSPNMDSNRATIAGFSRSEPTTERKERSDSYLEAFIASRKKQHQEDDSEDYTISLTTSRVDLQTQREMAQRLHQLKGVSNSIKKLETDLEKQYVAVARHAKLKVCKKCKKMLRRHVYEEENHPKTCKEVKLIDFLNEVNVNVL